MNPVTPMAPATMSLLGDYTNDFAFFPESASTFSADIDWVFYFISIVCLLFFIPIIVALFGFAWKYKKDKGLPAESQKDHNTTIELVWSIGPSFLLVVMFFFGARGYLSQRSIPEGAYEIGVKSMKWSWAMDYGNGVIHPELHVVVGEPTKLTMTSDDVIHSLYIPAFRVKKDVVPGRYNYMWFKATRPSEKVAKEELDRVTQRYKETGDAWDYDREQFTPDGYRFYDLYCTEYCGTSHSEMQTVVVVHETREELEAWIKKYSARPEGEEPAVYGQKLYERRGCKSCHSLDGSRMVGPSYQGSFGTMRQLADGESVRFDENYVRESILYPKAKVAAGYQPVMPSYKGQLSDDDVYSLVEFIKSLGDPSVVAAAEGDSEEGADETSAADGEGSAPAEEPATQDDAA
ncbi:cytochrome c oxidase subunit II [Roseiconus nitratireducens]|uniref:Cytochrome c oxidase subunit 2 n=1 Tax=Roseiconus nitratireducens TaxID=2605748 RepID=A0A5M6DL47_9BACT|nr:cytochrome c oxidase subunit II [Roseiconus nitratireducens]KAA5546949.1 cytochrome c oxidase subunit II [Roseiconus nitratireducens]